MQVGCLAGSWSFAVVKGFWALHDNIYECVLLLPFAMVWLSFDVKELWALCDNIITVALVMLLQETYSVLILQRSTANITSIWDHIWDYGTGNRIIFFN
jgi:hypothetical protein